MILMRIVARVRKDQVGIHRLQVLERGLDFAAVIRHESIAKRFQERSLQSAPSKECSRILRFGMARAYRAEYHPMETGAGITLAQLKNRAATANFEIVGMRPQAEHLECAALARPQVQLHHTVADTTWEPFWFAVFASLQTFQGAAPRLNSSNRCLSLNVSMHCQNPLYL